MKICQNCGAEGDGSGSVCISCGLPYDAPDVKLTPVETHGDVELPKNKKPSLKIWLIVDAVLVALLVCLTLFLPYPAQAYLVLACAVGLVAMLVLLVAAIPAGWNKLPLALLVAVFLIPPVVAYVFPNRELAQNSSAVLSMFRAPGTPAPSPSAPMPVTPTPAASMESAVTAAITAASPSAPAAPSPSLPPPPAPSPSPSPTPSLSPTPSSSPAPSPLPASSPSPAPSPSSVPSAVASPLPSPSPSLSPSVSPAPFPPGQFSSPAPFPSLPLPTPVPAASVEPSSRPPEPILAVSTSELFTQYDENELAADRAYKGKTVQVSGVFRSLSIDAGRLLVVISDGGTANINCYFDYAYASQLIDMHAGNHLALQGICMGKSPALRIERCTLVK